MAEISYRCEGSEETPHDPVIESRLFVEKAPKAPICRACGEAMAALREPTDCGETLSDQLRYGR